MSLILAPEQKEFCPNACDAYDQCATCLRQAHCGWCSKKGGNGEGICADGSLVENPAHLTCDQLYTKAYNTSTRPDDFFTWNYVKCPPENECKNGHHNCNPLSEECFDLPYGYDCTCATGYKLDKNNVCAPVCSDGCVRGQCIAPNQCSCDFGYVGKNCTVQCLCNGNANCAGPDKLDQCGPCHNNTMGARCEKCKKWYVKTGENGECVKCSKFCYGHTDICVPHNYTNVVNVETEDLSRESLDGYFTEGITGSAMCLNCQNLTAGNRCDSCVAGFFRETANRMEKCRPCEW